MPKFLTLSFDDGTVQDIRLVELFNRYGLRATFNLNSGLFGTRHRIVHDGIDCDHTEITSDQVSALYQGHEVAVHTVHHPNLLELDAEGILREVEGDRLALEALCGYPIIGMAYPGGPFYNDFVIRTITENTPIRYARTIEAHFGFGFPAYPMRWHPSCKFDDDRVFELADRFLCLPPEQDALFYIWGHSFEFDKYQSWDRAERFCAHVAGRDDVVYATNAEVLRHLEECGALRRTV